MTHEQARKIKIGAKVRCVNDYASFGYLLNGIVYTVTRNARGHLSVNGVDRSWRPERFDEVK